MGRKSEFKFQPPKAFVEYYSCHGRIAVLSSDGWIEKDGFEWKPDHVWWELDCNVVGKKKR